MMQNDVTFHLHFWLKNKRSEVLFNDWAVFLKDKHNICCEAQSRLNDDLENKDTDHRSHFWKDELDILVNTLLRFLADRWEDQYYCHVCVLTLEVEQGVN